LPETFENIFFVIIPKEYSEILIYGFLNDFRFLPGLIYLVLVEALQREIKLRKIGNVVLSA